MFKIKSKKGQYFTFDVIIAGIVAIFTIILLLNYWRYSMENNILYNNALDKSVIQAASLLFAQGGSYSILNSTTPTMLKNVDNEDLTKIIDSLNKSISLNLYVIKGNETIYGDITQIGYPQVKIDRLFYDPHTNKPVILQIYGTR